MPYSTEIDFDVFKALTALRIHEDDSYNDVLRRLLKLPDLKESVPEPELSGCWYSGVFFPEGTEFRATYKGRTYAGEIKNGGWVDPERGSMNSPSEAASHITGNNVNGWRFWHAKRPTDSIWTPLNRIRGDDRWNSNRSLFR